MAIEIHEQSEIGTFYLDDRDKRLLQVELWYTRRRRYSTESWPNETSARKALKDGLVKWEEWIFGGIQTGERLASTPQSLHANRRKPGVGENEARQPLVIHRSTTTSPKP